MLSCPENGGISTDLPKWPEGRQNVYWNVPFIWHDILIAFVHDVSGPFNRLTLMFVLGNRVFSLTWPASMQIYWNKRKRVGLSPTGMVWDTNMATVSLFWDTNMAAMTSCENTQYFFVLYMMSINQDKVTITSSTSISSYFRISGYRYGWISTVA